MNDLQKASRLPAERIYAATYEFMLSWLAGVRARPGNPVGMELIPVGSAVATIAPGAPDVPFMNTVYGFRPDDAHALDQVLALYEDQGLRPSFELFPYGGMERVTGVLAHRGFVNQDTYAALAAPIEATIAAQAARVDVRPVDAGEDPLFARTITAGHNLAGAALEQAVANTLPWRDLAHVTRFIGWSGTTAGGAAALMLRDGIGYLANAAVMPEYRRRGLHTALVTARIAAARNAGAELVCGITNSPISRRTMEGAGLGLVYEMSRWGRPA